MDSAGTTSTQMIVLRIATRLLSCPKTNMKLSKPTKRVPREFMNALKKVATVG